MSSGGLILIGSSLDRMPEAFIEQVLSHWPAHSRPKPKIASVDELLADDGLLDACRAAWIVTDDTETSDLHELITRLQDRHRAALITRAGERKPIGSSLQDGVIVAPPDAQPVAVCAMLRTLWQQAETIRALLIEIKILNAHNGGLATQFDKLDEELRLAAQLQREFLPTSLPSMEHMDFRVLFRPASYVSGDIYDVIRLDERHMGFFVADAVGHGVPAALLTVYIKRSLRTGNRIADDPHNIHIIPPDEALTHLNRDMVRQQSGNVRFATACYGIIDRETFQLTFARAGHPYPLLLRADGRTEWLEADGGLLGVFPDETYQIETVQLQPRDRLLLYSDGFEVAFPGAHAKGDGRRRCVANNAYADEFKDLANGTLDEAFGRLTRRLDAQSGSLNQVDDLTAVLIEMGSR